MSSTSHKAVLAVSDLAVDFSHHPALRGVSFEVLEGEMMALIGESGCGKSVTSLSIMRLLPPSASISHGRIMLHGQDLATLNARELRGIRGKQVSLILQEPMTSLNPVMTVGLQVSEIIRIHNRVSRRAARAWTTELYDLVGIPEPQRRFDQYPHSFSGGMRQRVMIAMAIACGPKLLIADEPTTALDVTIQAQVMDLLDRLRRDLDMSVLLITHDLGVVSQWVDRVAVMYAGRIVEQAPIDTFFTNARHPYSRALLNAAIVDTQHYETHRLAEIRGAAGGVDSLSGCAFAARCDQAETACWAETPRPVQLTTMHAAHCRRVTA